MRFFKCLRERRKACDRRLSRLHPGKSLIECGLPDECCGSCRAYRTNQEASHLLMRLIWLGALRERGIWPEMSPFIVRPVSVSKGTARLSLSPQFQNSAHVFGGVQTLAFVARECVRHSAETVY
jgi:hypothetical protein